MKKNDMMAISFMAGFGLLVFFFPFGIVNAKLSWKGFQFGINDFGAVTKQFPFIMGFLKVGILATFGEMLKSRYKTKSYKLSSIWMRFIVWGVYGMLFTVVFALFANGVQVISQINLWFNTSVDAHSSLSTRLTYAFSTSFWQNIIFAFPMMLSHEWINQMIEKKKYITGSSFMKNLDYNQWGSFIPKTIFMFWIPAHTITFLLPADFRVLVAALLSIALGFILSLKPNRTLKLRPAFQG